MLLPLLLPCPRSHSPTLVRVYLLSFACSCSPALIPPPSFPRSRSPALIRLLSSARSHHIHLSSLIRVHPPSFVCVCPFAFARRAQTSRLRPRYLVLAFVWPSFGLVRALLGFGWSLCVLAGLLFMSISNTQLVHTC